MCGITGVIGKKPGLDIAGKLILSNELIQHRGPDGSGQYLYNNMGLAHKRLSIIDLNKRGDQPMFFDDGNYVIVFNGEIYNYIELKSRLEQLSLVFTTQTDTEVILAAYQQWGKRCLPHFNGMWAFAILDKRSNNVFLSRDRFGIKPLYYYQNEDYFYFGSEIKQLLCFMPEVKANREIVLDYLLVERQDHTDQTFFKEVNAFPIAHYAYIDLDTHEFELHRYYTLSSQELGTKDNVQAAFDNALKQAVELRLRSDVKTGTSLSGGIDSSSITTIAAKLNQPETTYSITAKSEDKINDESHFAQEIAELYRLDWHVTCPKYVDFKQSMKQMFYILEEPFSSPSYNMQYFVLKQAKQDTCKVLLDGQGGDETLLGYERFYVAHLNEIKGLWRKIKSIFQIQKNSNLSLKNVLILWLYFNYLVFIKKLKFKKERKILKKPYRMYFNSTVLKQDSYRGKTVFQIQKHQFTGHQLKNQLVFADKIAMWHSIEVRFPFLDHHFVEMALNLPSETKIKDGWTKYILRKSVEDKLLKSIVWRKNKFGFEPPRSWINENKKDLLSEIVKSEFLKSFVDFSKLSGQSNNKIWRLYSLGKWAEEFNVTF